VALSTTRSATSVYLSNGADLVAIWQANRLTPTDQVDRGPGLTVLHYLGGRASNWPVNHILAHTGAFRDESAPQLYTEPARFGADAWLENAPDRAGALTTRYTQYRDAVVQPRCTIERHHVAVPGQPFLVIRYVLTNPTSEDLIWSVLDQLRLNNVGDHDPAQNTHGWYDDARTVLIADMSASGQYFLVLGAFGAMDGHQVGDDAEADPTAATVAGGIAFARDGTLPGNGDARAATVNLSFCSRLTIAAGQTASVDLFLIVQPTLDTALATADVVRAESAQHWCDVAATAHVAWLDNGGKGRRSSLTGDGFADHYDRSLLMIKNMQHPIKGTIVASSNPIAYGYKTWVRDGSIAAIALDASGHYDEAALYWRWMASAQGGDGTWKTTYDFWSGNYVQFVEPEYDSVGTFLYGAYRHYRATGDATFLADLWPAVKRSADWLLTSISGNGFAAADYSIWEEQSAGLQHNSFTQAWFVAGLWATQCLAEARGDTALADWYAGGAASIQSALQRPSDWYPPGAWNVAGYYYNRGVNDNNTPADLQDSSSNLLVALGVVDGDSARARQHLDTIVAALTHNGYGLARYRNDRFYYDGPWNPAGLGIAGDEVGAPEPSWPQMSMWVAAHQSMESPDEALRRMEWFLSTTGVGYMPQGEAVSNVTSLPVLSSMSEPLTAGSFILTSLILGGVFDVRIRPPIVNAGAFKLLTVRAGSIGDRDQWHNVPYFVGTLEAGPRNPQTKIRRVYLANDAYSLYLCIDNMAGALPSFSEEPGFAVRIYAGDFAGAAATVPWGLERRPLSRPGSFAVACSSNEGVFRHWTAAGGDWSELPPLQAHAPQWDPGSGRVELAVPINALSSGSVNAGSSWAPVVIALAAKDAAGNWVDDDRVTVHYRFSAPTQSWLYGDIEA
jgi:hypothetical protein